MNAQEAGHSILLSRLECTIQFVIMTYGSLDTVHEHMDDLLSRMWQAGFHADNILGPQS
jgi:hypothetical protein